MKRESKHTNSNTLKKKAKVLSCCCCCCCCCICFLYLFFLFFFFFLETTSTRTVKKFKDAPKNAKNAFQCFSAEQRPILKEKNPTWKMGEFSKALGYCCCCCCCCCCICSMSSSSCYSQCNVEGCEGQISLH